MLVPEWIPFDESEKCKNLNYILTSFVVALPFLSCDRTLNLNHGVSGNVRSFQVICLNPKPFSVFIDVNLDIYGD